SLLGTDFFDALRSPYVGRILISNFVNYKATSDISYARNNGSIDIVLDKTNKINEELPKAIAAAKNKFFTAISNELFEDAEKDNPLADTDFARFFTDKINELKPSEIIPNETFTRFTFKFETDAPSISLHVTNKQEIAAILMTDVAESAPIEVRNHLSSGKYILCPDDPAEVLPDGRLWPLY